MVPLVLAALQVLTTPSSPACFNSSALHTQMDLDAPGHPTSGSTLEACGAACCGDPECSGFTFTLRQPTGNEACEASTPCCWIKTGQGKLVTGNCGLGNGNCTSAVVRGSAPPEPSQFWTPTLNYVKTIALDPTGNLRDPSSVVQDPQTKRFHFWVDYMPGGTQPGWHAYLHHYSASEITGPWKNHGLALNHSADPRAWDYSGQFSSSVIYSAEEQLWYLFYSASGANQSSLLTCAQLAASSRSPDGPWTVLGAVAIPTGVPSNNWTGGWNTRRLDSGRALIIGGQKGYWTKGVQGKNIASEGLYIPHSQSSFAPPYAEAPGNPRFKPPASDSAGYENCEFFKGSDPAPSNQLHIWCSWHSGNGIPGLPRGQAPHFVVNLATDPLGEHWIYAGSLNWQNKSDLGPAPGEPTPVYENGAPGDGSSVQYFIARQPTGHKGAGALAIGLYSLSWIAPGV